MQQQVDQEPQVMMTINGITITGKTVDKGSSLNALYQHQWIRLGKPVLHEPTFNNWMANQTSPIGLLDKVWINVPGVPSTQVFVVIRVPPKIKAYPTFQRPPWLIATKVIQDWGRYMFTLKTKQFHKTLHTMTYGPHWKKLKMMQKLPSPLLLQMMMKIVIALIFLINLLRSLIIWSKMLLMNPMSIVN